MHACTFTRLSLVGSLVIATGVAHAQRIENGPSDGSRSQRTADAASGNEQIRILVQGTLATNQVAIGGEITGTTISANGLTFEIDLSDQAQAARRVEKWDGQPVSVEGSLYAKRSPERGQRLLIRPTRIRPLHSLHDPRNKSMKNAFDSGASKSDSTPDSRPNASAKNLRMEELRWQRRPLLIFAPDQTSDSLQKQTEPITDVREKIDERDMAILQIVGSRGTIDGQPLTSESVRQLRSRYDIDQDQFAVLLVGKDGTVKLKRNEPVAWKTLFERIDSMPMRKREMQQ